MPALVVPGPEKPGKPTGPATLNFEISLPLAQAGGTAARAPRGSTTPSPSPTSWRCWASTQERPAPRTRSASDAYVLKRIFPLALLASARRWCFWYAAYRQWMLWLRLRLGQSNRRPLPSCMVKTIRD
ncbi:hypothetical protein ISCGN_011582 [Ixodes scapularis]